MSHIKTKFLSGLLIGTALLTGTVASANDTSIMVDISENAIKLAKRIQSDNLIATLDETRHKEILASTPQDKRIDYLRRVTMNSLALRNNLNQSDLISAYDQMAIKSGDTRDIALSALYKIYHKHHDTSGQFKNYEEFTVALTPYLESNDWVISHRAKIFLALAESYSLDLNTALANALDAHNDIPNEQSEFVDEAVMESLDIIAYLHNLLNNPEMAIKATEDMINRQIDDGYEIDGISLINNLIYSFNKWRDFETASQLAEILVSLEGENTAGLKGLSQLRLAQTLNDKSDYTGALKAVDSIITKVDHKGLRANLLINRAVALAGLGRIEEAEKAMAAYEDFKSEISLNSNNLQSRELMAEALLARAHGDMVTSFAKMQERFTIIVQRILTSNNNSTAKLLANLENSKERQEERENALIREADLKQAKLEQQQRINQLLMALAGFLGIAAICAVAFARYRDKISKELAIKTEEALSADKMKSEFLGMISHELRTPLNGIIGIADLLSTQGPTEDVRMKTSIILDSGNLLCDVVENIVDMSSIDSGKLTLYPEPINISRIATELDQDWRPIIEGKGITFTTFVDPMLSETVELDGQRFQQCLKNLLSNAAKFTEEGRIHLHITGVPIEGAQTMGITAVIADTGHGMSEEVQAKLFKPFLQADSSMTRKFGGSGLGLAITRSIARMMDGDVTLDSKKDRGSIFTLTAHGKRSDDSLVMDEIEELLQQSGDDMPMRNEKTLDPAQGKDDVQTEIAPAPELMPHQTIDINVSIMESSISALPAKSTIAYDTLRGLKVLIVEDMPSNQEVIKLFLEPEGCEMLCAANGLEALDILGTQAVDIILMDIRMPAMDGIEAMRAIRSQQGANQHVPIIALTADAAAETNADCMAAGADIFLTKPVMCKGLTDAIRFLRRLEQAGREDDEAEQLQSA